MRSIDTTSHFVPCLAERFATTIGIMRIADGLYGLSVLPWIDERLRSFRKLLVSIASANE
jgi:hypothetical protein